MEVFFDTNILLESLANRKQANAVDKILNLIYEKKINGYISAGTIYTLSYLVEQHLKEHGKRNPRRLKELRELLTSIASCFSIIDMPTEEYLNAINNDNFKDIEDSFQFQMAKSNRCDVLLTINIKDFKLMRESSDNMEILTPTEFLSRITETKFQ